MGRKDAPFPGLLLLGIQTSKSLNMPFPSFFDYSSQSSGLEVCHFPMLGAQQSLPIEFSVPFLSGSVALGWTS